MRIVLKSREPMPVAGKGHGGPTKGTSDAIYEPPETIGSLENREPIDSVEAGDGPNRMVIVSPSGSPAAHRRTIGEDVIHAEVTQTVPVVGKARLLQENTVQPVRAPTLPQPTRPNITFLNQTVLGQRELGVTLAVQQSLPFAVPLACAHAVNGSTTGRTLLTQAIPQPEMGVTLSREGAPLVAAVARVASRSSSPEPAVRLATSRPSRLVPVARPFGSPVGNENTIQVGTAREHTMPAEATRCRSESPCMAIPVVKATRVVESGNHTTPITATITAAPWLPESPLQSVRALVLQQSTLTTPMAPAHPGTRPAIAEVSTADIARRSSSNTLREPTETVLSSDGSISEMNDKKRATTAMHSGQLRRLTEEIFRFYAGESGFLDWNSGGIRSFTLDVFKQLNLPTPKEHQIYAMYARFDADGDWRLDVEESSNLIEMLSCSLLGIEGEEHRARLVMKSGVVRNAAESSFKAHDTNNDGFLSWENGEIESFIRSLFERLGLPCPSKEDLHATFMRFDNDRSGSMELNEGVNFVESFCRSISQIEMADRASCCAAGHTMVVFSTPCAGYQCANCQATFGAHIGIWQCDPCKYYLCISCSKERRADVTKRLESGLL